MEQSVQQGALLRISSISLACIRARLWRSLLPVLLGTTYAGDAGATHLSGGEITWQCTANNIYQVRLKVFRDCMGAPMYPFADLHFTNGSISFTMALTADAGQEISQLCPSQLPNSRCNGGMLPGMQQYTFSANIPLAPSTEWKIRYTETYRNEAILNLFNPGLSANHIYATLNTALAPCNSSPQFTSMPIPYVCLGQPVVYSYGVYDPDSDSLSYELVGARGANGVLLPYWSQYSGSQPITGIVLDPVTGQLNFTPVLTGMWVVVVRVSEYNSAGQLIGTVIRDMQFVVMPCSNLQPNVDDGTIEDLTGASVQTGPRSIQLCPGGSFCFDMTIGDPNAGDVLTATSNILQNLPGATFSYTGTNPIICTVCCNSSSMVNGVFPFVVNVNDNACPIPGTQTYVYSVNVVDWLQVLTSVVDEGCAGQGNGSITAEAWAGAEPFTYQWSTGDNGPQIIAGAGEYTVVVSDANGCASQQQTVTIGAMAPATANAGPDMMLCAGQGTVQLAGSVGNASLGTWSGGGGTFSGTWPDVSYQPGGSDLADGTVTLTLTAVNASACPPAQDDMQITFNTAFLGLQVIGTAVTCAGASDGTASVQPQNPGLSYAWNDPAQQTTAIATGLAGGDWTVTVNDGSGCSAQFNVNVPEPAPLQVTDIQTTDQTCLGVGSGTATPTVVGGNPPYAYLWSTGDEAQVLVAGGGNYSLLVSDANGCPAAMAQATIVSTGVPSTADAGADLVVCTAGQPFALQGSVINAPAGVWSGGTGSFLSNGIDAVYQASSADQIAGSVSLVLTTAGNTDCPQASDTVQVVLGAGFSGTSIVTNDITCNGLATGIAEVMPVVTGHIYQWNDPSSQVTAVATGLTAGSLSLTITDGLGCDTTLTTTINEPAPLSVQVTHTDAICNGMSTGTASATVIGGTPTYAMVWSTGDTGDLVNALPAGPITVNVIDMNGCAASASANVNEPAPITVDAQVPDTVCANALVLLSAQASGGSGVLLYTWSGFGTGSGITASFGQDQVVQLLVTDTAGCSSAMFSQAVTVLDLGAAQLNTSGDSTVCAGGTASVGASVSGYPGATTISWPGQSFSGGGPFDVQLFESATIHVSATDVCGHSLSDSIVLSVDVPPVFPIGPVIAEGCAPMQAQFPDPSLGPGFTYLWDLGNGTTSSLAAPQPLYTEGLYTASLVITTPLGCSSTVPMTGIVRAWPPPHADFSADPWTALANDGEISFTDLSTDSITMWSWTFGDGAGSADQDPVANYDAAGSYPVELWVQDVHGCSDTIVRMITIDPVYEIGLPNAFTPDPSGSNGGIWIPGDLSNDVFYALVDFALELRMRIYNRWGELIHESNDPSVGWDGYYRGSLCPQDVYTYQLVVRFKDDKVVVRTGDVTLLR